ncbi:putative pectinesterase/pectinesterase inhibitor 13 [Camellia lanceoleosa]|uniref:Pectinesterase/pectinesterase inhibitor 13 n=1 Tax=Camellia lanceoleosa TaxID=1840588 RepID=A0ACC0GPD4_9ERIC|nr:putative pectinesterase/pectinesterase inhibitor 13 [Camellia lanceoleosa]
MKGGKFAIVRVSGIFLVAAVIGVIVVGVNNKSFSDSGSGGKSSDDLSTSSKSVASICSYTDYKQTCVSSLDMMANNQSATPQDFLQAAINFTINQRELKKAMSDGLFNATQLTDNALSIVSTISQLLSTFDINLDMSASFRRLLETSSEGDGGGADGGRRGYPDWISMVDRKLLGASKNSGRQLKPNAVVAKDESGQYKTIATALAAYPKNNKGRYIIYIKEGIYDEYITVTKDQVNVFMYGDRSRKTMVTGKKSNTGGFPTFRTAF